MEHPGGKQVHVHRAGCVQRNAHLHREWKSGISMQVVDIKGVAASSILINNCKCLN